MRYFSVLILLISTIYASNLNWSHNYEATIKQAKKEHKRVYMLITSKDCRWCRKFESTTLQEKEVLKRLKKEYILLHISRDEDYMPEYFKKKRVPRHYFLNRDGDIIYSFLGYWVAEDFFSFLDDVDKRYKKNFLDKGLK